MSTSASLTSLYLPSTTGTVTTSWIPMTSAWGNARGSGASSFWTDETQKHVSGWLWDDDLYSWSAQWLPPEVTMSVRSSVAVANTDNTVYSIGPFAGCPASFSTVSTDGVATTCCPVGFTLTLLGETTASPVCTSLVPTTVSSLVYMGWDMPVVNVTVNDRLATVTVTSTAVFATYTATRTLYPGNVGTISALAVRGWNFEVAETSTGNSLTSCPSTSASASPAAEGSISTGAIAGLAVTSAIAATSTRLLLWMLMARRREKRVAYDTHQMGV